MKILSSKWTVWLEIFGVRVKTIISDDLFSH